MRMLFFTIGCIFSVTIFIIPSFGWLIDIVIKIGLLISYFALLYFINIFEEAEIQKVKEVWMKLKNLKTGNPF